MQSKVTFRHYTMCNTLIILTISSLCLAQSNMWETKTPMPTARYGFGASAVDGLIYVIGGNAGAGTNSLITSIVEAYDPTQDIWHTGLREIPVQREFFATALLNGKIYAMGGQFSRGAGLVAYVQMYDPANNTWVRKQDMAIPRNAFGATTVNGKIYAMGGVFFAQGLVYSAVEEYDPQTDTWTRKSDMPTPRFSIDIAAVNGKIYACGGERRVGGGSAIDVVEVYDPVTDTWESKANLPAPRSGFSACELNGRLYIVSGSGNVQLTTSVLEYDPNTDTWTEVAPIPTARTLFAAVSVDGCLYAIGGSSGITFTPVSVVEAYCPPVTGVDDNSSSNLEAFALAQNYPNPFNPTTTIAFDLPKSGFVTLKIFDIAGQEVRTLVNEQQSAGAKTVVWDGRDQSGRQVSSGIYVYRLQAGDAVQSRKMLLVQ